MTDPDALENLSGSRKGWRIGSYVFFGAWLGLEFAAGDHSQPWKGIAFFGAAVCFLISVANWPSRWER